MGKNSYRRIRQTADLARRPPKRAPYDRVLVVCEGEKTEPLYLNDIRQEYHLSSAYVSIVPSEYGTQPLQIVQFAIDEFKRTKEFEAVFVVFDRDAHTTYHNALTKARAFNLKMQNDEGKPVPFTAVPSVPCFEFWLLLHFANIQAFFERGDIQRKLKTHIADYEKGNEGIYTLTKANLAVATDRAARLRSRYDCQTGTDPYTNVDELVKKLQSIRPMS